MIKKHWPIILIWFLGLFLRCYRQGDLLGFYYDQGRDAAIAADIISFKNFPAIGPTTGIAGLYLGPFWYYLITPGYIILVVVLRQRPLYLLCLLSLYLFHLSMFY